MTVSSKPAEGAVAERNPESADVVRPQPIRTPIADVLLQGDIVHDAPELTVSLPVAMIEAVPISGPMRVIVVEDEFGSTVNSV